MSGSIRVVIFKEGDLWVAQGLEHDICVQGASLDDVRAFFEVAVRLEDNEDGGIERIAPAPEHFHRQWDRRSGEFKPIEQSAYDGQIEYGMAA